jgi:hypothetical protein
MVVYLWVSSTIKTDWYNWILYDLSLSITYRRTVVYLKVSSTNKTVPFWLKLTSNLQKNSGLSQDFFNQKTDGYNRTLYDLSLSVTYWRMVVYLWVSSTNKNDWYNWILYNLSLSVTYRRMVVYLKVSSTIKTDRYNWIFDLSLSVTYRRMVVYLKVSSTNTTVPLWFMFASNLQKNSGLSQGFFNNKKTDWYNWTFIWLKFVSNLQKNSGLSQGFFNQ